MRIPFASAAVLFAAVLLVGCSDDGNDPTIANTIETTIANTIETATSAPGGTAVAVIAIDNTFRPEVVEIAAGDTVTWTNRGVNEHDVLSVEAGDWGVDVVAFQPGDTWSYTFTEPGEYRYYCSVHGNEDVGMIGTVVVT